MSGARKDLSNYLFHFILSYFFFFWGGRVQRQDLLFQAVCHLVIKYWSTLIVLWLLHMFLFVRMNFRKNVCGRRTFRFISLDVHIELMVLGMMLILILQYLFPAGIKSKDNLQGNKICMQWNTLRHILCASYTMNVNAANAIKMLNNLLSLKRGINVFWPLVIICLVFVLFMLPWIQRI